jgi:uncharacterized protein (DUF927 family)
LNAEAKGKNKMKSAVFDPSEYSFLELMVANGKSTYQVEYDKWIAIYGSHIANLFKAYAMSHNGSLMPQGVMEDAKKEAYRLANFAAGLKQ